MFFAILKIMDEFDLHNLEPSRLLSMVVEAPYLKLLFGTEKVTEESLRELKALAKKAKVMEQMRAMQTGEIVNTSEKRPALHTAMRDVFGETPLAKEASALAKKELEKLKAFLPQLEGVTDLVQIGIGGSSLGPDAIYQGLKAFAKPGKRVHFLSNVDPDDAAAVFRDLDLKKTVVVVVSKSGTTLETLTNEAIAREKFKKAGLPPKIIAVTGEKSPMDDPKNYLASFYIWDFVGGRYSVTSMVGAVALSFALGFDQFMDFLKGAHEMDRHALLDHNMPLIGALLGIFNRNHLGCETAAVIPYAQGLHRFPAHLQQLDMESNGKQVTKKGDFVTGETGPIVWGEPGTNGQHSFFQLLHQGTSIVPLEFIGFKKSQYGDDLNVQGTTSQQKLLSNLIAQMIALATGQENSDPNKVFLGNRPSRLILGERLDPATLGALLAYFEHKVAFQGFMWGINSFDQEGVQLGKKLALKVIDQFAGKKVDFPLSSALLKILS
jgi:glucose-6-phosphate isomerase